VEKRSLFWCVTALMAGMYVMHFAPDMIPALPLVGLCVLLLIGVYFTGRAVLPLFMVLLFLLGAFHMRAAADVTCRPLYPFLDEYVTIEANCIKEPEQKEGYRVIWAEIQSVSFLGQTTAMCEKVRLTAPDDEPDLNFGDSFTAVCSFSLPSDAMNAGSFDYQLYLQSKKIFFSGRLESGTVERTGTFSLSFSQRLYNINRRCFRVLLQTFPEDGAALLQAMALGDSSALTDSLQEALQVAGLSHVTAVSGMHVTSLVSLLYMLLSVLRQNKNRYVLLTGGVLITFMLFTGAGPSVVRATIMGLLVLLAFVCLRKEDGLTSLALSAGVIVLINPMSALDTGFMLSYAATAGILLFAKPVEETLLRLLRLQNAESRYKRILAGGAAVFSVTLAAQIFVFPLSAWIFGSFSLWSFLSNLVIAPLAPILLTGGLLIGFLGLIHPVLTVLPAGFFYPFIKLFLGITYLFGKFPVGLITVGTLSSLGLYIYGLLLAGLCARLYPGLRLRAKPFILSSAILFVCFVCVHLFFPMAELTFINVGNADCSLLRLPGNVHVLIDGGGRPAYMGEYHIGTEIVLPYLKRRGVRKLDYMIASHPHEDHINGLSDLLGAIPTERLLVSRNFCDTEAGADLVEKARSEGVEVLEVDVGEILNFDEAQSLQILSPAPELLETGVSENDCSLVTKFEFGDSSVLFTGDIEEDAEHYLVSQNPEALDSDILKVAHHGSGSSSTAEFLTCVQPDYAYIPCGKNAYGHPEESVLKRLGEVGATVFRADYHKDVTFTLYETGIAGIKTGGKQNEN